MMSGAIPLKDIATGLLYELDPEYERLVRSAPEQKVVREVTSGKWYSWAEFAVLVPELTEMLGEGLEDVKGLDEAKAGEGREGMATATEAALQEQALGKKKKKGWGIRKLFGKKEAGTAKAASGPQPAAAAPGQARGPGAAGTLTDAAAGGGGEQSPQSNSTRETPMSWRDGQPGHSRPASSSGAAELPSGVRAYSHQRVMSELTDLRVLQTLPAHDGHIWCMAFNQEGSRLASAGQDRVIRLWRVLPRAAPADSGFRPATFAAEQASRGEGAAPEADEENHGMRRQPNAAGPGRTGSGIADGAPELGSSSGGGGGADAALLEPAPAGVLAGHDDIIMDLEWSASTFLLSASMDKTVRLWHVSSSQQLRVYRHTDIVTSVSMHPIASTFFASASVDATIRIWSITDMKVVDYDKLDSDDMLSCCQFSRTGNRLLVGTTKGRCRFYTVHLSPQPNLGLKYLSQFDVRNAAGKHAKGRKVTGFSTPPGEADGAEEQVLITTGDNRLRLYHNTVQVCKYKGHRNQQTMIAASFSPDGQYIICGSDDGQVFLWAADSDLAGVPLGSGGGYKRREKTQSYECFKAFDSVCTVAVFAPPSSWQRRATEAPAVPITKAAAALIRSGTTSSTMSVGSRATDEELQRAMTRAQAHLRQARLQGAVIVTASVNGEIRVFENVGGPSWI